MLIDKTHCSDCRNNFYNGNNDIGVSECWHLKDAKLERRLLVHINHCPPYDWGEAKMVPNCYSRPKYVSVKKEALDSHGYWSR